MSSMFIKGLAFMSLALFSLISHGEANERPHLNCVLTDSLDDNNGFKQKETFNKNTAMIYLVCSSADVQVGQRITAAWIAANTKGVAPDDYKIGEKSFTVLNNVEPSEEWTAKYSLSKPNAGWPDGQYHVDIYVDEQKLRSFTFQVDANK